MKKEQQKKKEQTQQNISMSSELRGKVMARAEQAGLPFSKYCTFLFELDLAKNILPEALVLNLKSGGVE